MGNKKNPGNDKNNLSSIAFSPKMPEEKKKNLS